MGVKLPLCYGSKRTKDLREPGAEGDTEPKMKYQAVGGNCVMTWFMICTTGKYYNHQIKDDEKSGTIGTHVKKKLHTYFRDRSEDLEVGEKIILKWFLNKQHGRVLSRLKWLRIRKSFVLLRMQQ
jgi:hypothetical protein